MGVLPRPTSTTRAFLPAAGVAALAAVAGLAPSCRPATEIVVRVTTDFDCSRLGSSGVALHVGASTAFGPASSLSASCAGDYVGSVVLVPSDNGNAVFFDVTAALAPQSLDASGTCTEGSAGCIHARRSLRYLSHESLLVPIQLQQECAGVVCDPDSTCYSSQCVPAAVDPSTCEGSGGCPPPSGDGGAAGSDGCGETSGLQAGSPWPMLGRCPTHSGRASTAGPKSLTVKWTAPLDASGTQCPSSGGFCDLAGPVVAADGTIYLPGLDGLYAFHPDGTRAWKVPLGGAAADESPTIGADGTIYVGSVDHNLYAVSPGGTVAWTFDAGAPVAASPAIAPDGTIYFYNSTGVWALDHGGTQRWSLPAAPGLDVSLSADAGTIYAGSGSTVLALAPDETTQWSYDAGAGLTALSVASDGRTVFGAGGSVVMSLTASGDLAWRATSLGLFNPPATLADGTAIYSDPGRHTVTAVDAAGNEEWHTVLGDTPTISPVVGANGTIYAVSDDGFITAIAPDGTTLSSQSLTTAAQGTWGPLSAMAIGADGTLYVATEDGTLLAIGP
jgi:outer membrane protein assembly factor BamB